MATAVTHYTSYKARPFTREERDKVTILFGGLTWKHERLVQGVFNNLNYNAKPLPNITRAGPRCRQRTDRRGRVLPHDLYDRQPGELPEDRSGGQRQETDD